MEVNVDSVKRAFEEHPIEFISVLGGLFVGLAKIVEAVGNSRGSHAYARDVKRRIKRDQNR